MDPPSPGRVLIIDDNRDVRDSAAAFLRASSLEVETAVDGFNAIEKLERGFQPDVILLDVVMPRMDGFELYTAIRRRHPRLPVLMMTAFHYDKDHIIKRSRLRGLDGVIFKKPVDPERLRQVLIDTVEASRKAR